MSTQAWTQADFSCGSCGHRFTATTEQEYLIRFSIHHSAHDLVARLTPELRDEVRGLLSVKGGEAGH